MTRFVRVFSLLLFAVWLSACSTPDQAPDGYPDPGTDPVAIAIEASTKSPRLGELVRLFVTARIDADLEFVNRDEVERGDALVRDLRAKGNEAAYVVVDPVCRLVELADGSKRVYAEIGVRPLRLEALQLPAISIRAKNPGGEVVEAKVEPPALNIVSALEGESDRSAEIDPALVADAPRPPLWPWLVGLGAVLLLALVAWAWRRYLRRELPAYVAEQIPPDQQAMARIRELERMLERGEIGGERLVVESSATLRRWLEDGLGQQSLARTTDEFLDDLRSTTRFSVAQQNRLQDFLRRCDLIKFAGQEPTLSECQDLLASVRVFVEETSKPTDSANESAAASLLVFPMMQGTKDALPADGMSFYEWQESVFGFGFADPMFLLLLLAIPVLLWLSRRDKPALGYASAAALDSLPASLRLRLSWLPRACAILALVPLILACARPQTFERVQLEQAGVDIMLTLDLSSSMAARDMAKGSSRLDVVKRVAEDFIKARKSDRIGLVAFARYPDLICPSTLDHPALLRFLEPLQHKRQVQYLGDRGDVEDGTAIGAGLALAVDRLEDLDSKSRVVILLSDGEETVGEILPKDAAKLAKDAGIRVYTVGAGRGLRGPMGMVRKPDFQALKSIAKTTDGAFFEADSEAALARVFDRIDELERVDLQDPLFAVDEEFWVFLWIGFALFAVGGFLRLLVFVSLP